jgi:type IV secretion system protein VirB10
MRKLLTFIVFALLIMVPVTAQEPPPAPPENPLPGDAPPKVTEDDPPAKAASKYLTVPAGTHLPLVLHNSITTRSNKPGDPIYLETTFPIILEDRIVIPAGSYVSGEILDSKRPGKVKGRGELMIRLSTLILPNGYAVKFDAIPTGAGTGANDTVEEEGRIKGDTDKSSDVGTVLKTTGVGAGIGALGTGSRVGAGAGAAAGAAAGLLWTLLTRGPELELPRGTTLDIMLDRPLYLDAAKINFTDPGRASALAGPPNRQPQRQRVPF